MVCKSCFISLQFTFKIKQTLRESIRQTKKINHLGRGEYFGMDQSLLTVHLKDGY